MEIFLFLFLLILGLTMIIRPKIFFIFEKWKFEGRSNPSKYFILNIRLGGIPLVIVSLIAIYLILSA